MNAEPAVPVLLFQVSGLTGALPCVHVTEAMRALPITAIDQMPPFVYGVATIRGQATPVIDTGALLGRPAETRDRLILVRAGTRVAALGVDEITGLRTFERAALSSRPPLLGNPAEGYVASLASRERELYLVLDAARIVEAAGSAA